MNVVVANKFYYLRGGAERAVFDLTRLLVRHGHRVVPFAMRDPKNLPSDWSRFFVSPVGTERVRFGWQGLRTAGRALYSFEAKRKFAALLDEAKPDIVHVHNIYRQISPSILPEAKKRGLPVVMTAHDYALVAPNYALYHDGAICEHTKPDRYWRAVGDRCVKHSFVASGLVAAEMTLHKLLGLYRDNVDAIIAPSRFAAGLLADYGVDPKKIVHIPHFIDTAGWTPSYGGNYVLYVGRLSDEKGVEALILAAALRKDIPVRIIGDGPEGGRIRALVAKLGATNVIMCGALDGDDLQAAYAGAKCVVVPSVWYEVFGLVVLEAYAAGKPVVASKIGALAELVKDGDTGLHAAPGDHKDLAQKLGTLWDTPGLSETMGRTARAWVERDFTPERHYERIMEVYTKARK